jgi:hypothetical protein
VEWWDQNVRSQGEARKENPDPHFLSKTQCEEFLGILQPQISKWRKGLAGIGDRDFDLADALSTELEAEAISQRAAARN